MWPGENVLKVCHITVLWCKIGKEKEENYGLQKCMPPEFAASTILVILGPFCLPLAPTLCMFLLASNIPGVFNCLSASIIQPLYLWCKCIPGALSSGCLLSKLYYCYKCIIVPASELSAGALGLTDSPSAAQTMQLLRAPTHFGPSYVGRYSAV